MLRPSIFTLLILGFAQAATAATESYHRSARSYGTRPDSDPPKYAQPLSTLDAAWSGFDWLDAGLDFRWRYEYRDDDLRRTRQILDDPQLVRSRLFLGVRQKLDPLRLGIELEDARRYNGGFEHDNQDVIERDNRDINEFELIQLYAELYFRDLLGHDALGNDRPLSLRVGRMAFEYMDRRLIGNNQWRNTTNNFLGARLRLGQEANDWQLDLLAVQPLNRLKYEWDKPVEGQWFYSFIGQWRRWSEIVTLQPCFLSLQQDRQPGVNGRQIHSAALRGYGEIGASGWDYDFGVVWQFGRDGSAKHRAFGLTSEIGHSFDKPWQPRLSLFYGYASGDRDPNDRKSQRFEKYFGFFRPWSANDYIAWENLHSPKARLEFQPRENLAVDLGCSAYWLASATDSWDRAQLRDPSGRSGRFLGHEFDMRVIWKMTARAQAILGYAYFTPGSFTRAQGKPQDSDFFYLEITLKAF